MVVEGAVVHGEPRLLVLADPERAGLDTRSEAGGQWAAHLMKEASFVQSEALGQLDMSVGRLEHPPVHVPAALGGDHRDGGAEKLGTDRGHLVAMVRMHDEFEAPRVVALGDLCVGDGVVMTRLPGDEAGETGAAALDEIEPGVVVDGPLAVGPLDVLQKSRDGLDVGLPHVPLDLEAPRGGRHGRRLSSRDIQPVASPIMASPPSRTSRPRTPKGRAREVMLRLAEAYPDALCELDHHNAYELLTATILSAQTTDARVNMVTPVLFAKYPTPDDLAAANPGDVEEIIRSTGFYQNKTRSIIGMAQALVERFNGEVPTKLEDLVTIPGVGRKTGNVVRSVAFDLPGLPVDTHVLRLSKRLGLTEQDDPVKVEHELNAMVPAAERGRFSLRLILHGRRVCDARKPRCELCVLEDICPSSRLPRRRAR
jgi:endonuclease III